MPTQIRLEDGNIRIQAADGRLSPGFKLVVTWGIDAGKEFPMGVSGRLLASDRKVLCQLEEGRIVGNEMTLSVMRSTTAATVQVEFFAPLSQPALQHIENLRRSSAPHDVTLEVEIWGRSMIPTAGALFTEGKSVASPDGQQMSSLISVVSGQDRGSWVLVQDSHQGLVKSSPFELKGLHTIPASTWSYHFAPALGLGTFVVVEFPLPVAQSGTPVDEALAAAVRDLQRAERELVGGGDDDSVIASLRTVADALRSYLPRFKQMLIDEGVPTDAADDYATMVQKAYDYSSKFVHSTDRGGTVIRAAVHAKREDVIFVFTTIATALHVMAKKSARLAP